MRIKLLDRHFGTMCATHGKRGFTRGETYTWEQDELTTRNLGGYMACKDFVPSESTAVLIQAKNKPSTEGMDQFCPLTVEIETGSGVYKTKQMDEWYDASTNNKEHPVYRGILII